MPCIGCTTDHTHPWSHVRWEKPRHLLLIGSLILGKHSKPMDPQLIAVSVLDKAAPPDRFPHPSDIGFEELAGRVSAVIIGEMLHIVLAVFAVDNGESDFSRALPISFGWSQHLDRGVNNRFETGQIGWL